MPTNTDPVRALATEGRVNRAYAERNALAVAFAKAALAAGWNAGRGYDDDPNKDWEPGWRHVIYVDLPGGGQVSWHMSPNEVHLLDGLPAYTGQWDGTFIARNPEWVNSLAQQPAAPVLAKHQPCGCVICTCEDEQQCQGCGARHCGNRTDHPPYVVQQPAAPSGEAVAWLRMKPDGTPDWAEDCIGSDDKFLDHEMASDGYYLQPLYAAPQLPAGVDEDAAHRQEEGE